MTTPTLKNYRVVIASRGRHKQGTVLPAWWVGRANPKAALDDAIAEEVARGVVAPTDDPVTAADLTVPEQKADTDPNPVLADRANALTRENQLLADNAAALKAQNESYKAQLASRDRALGEQTTEIDRLRAALAAAEAELETLTAPAAA